MRMHVKTGGTQSSQDLIVGFRVTFLITMKEDLIVFFLYSFILICVFSLVANDWFI